MAKHLEPSRSDDFTSLLDNIPCSHQSSLRSAVTRGAVATRRRFSLMAVSVLAVGLMLGGCGRALTRPPVTEQDLLKLRTRGDEQSVAASRKLLGKLLERTKTEYDRRAAAGLPRAGDRHPDHFGWGGLGSLRGGVSQGVAGRFQPSTLWPNPNLML